MMTREEVLEFLKDTLNYNMILHNFTQWAETVDTEHGIKTIADRWMLDQANTIRHMLETE